MAGEHPRLGGPGQVPHPHRGVQAVGDRGTSVRADRHRGDVAATADEHLRLGGPARSHTRSLPPKSPLTAVRPSALTATAFTELVWPVSTCGAAVPARSHTRTVPSKPPLTAVRPSALTATAFTVPSWPVSTCGAALRPGPTRAPRRRSRR